MTAYMHNRFNERHNHNTWDQNMWPQRNYLLNRHNARSAWTPPGFDIDLNYWCETCDKGFRTPDHLEFHIKLHQKCNIDGCQFVAHPKVITRHIQMQHATGLFKKIGRLNNPEEIKKWRDERKKKYPTKANIEKKQAEIKEKQKRGERMGLNQRKKNIVVKKGLYKNGKMHSSVLNKKTVNNRKRTLSEKSNKERKAKKICKALPPMEVTRKLNAFKGIQDLINEEKIDDDEQIIQCSNIIEDEDYNLNNCDKTDSNSKPSLCGALTSLICDYGSSDEDIIKENANAPTEVKTVETNTTTSTSFKIYVKPIEKLIDTEKILSIQCQNKSEDDSGPEESQIVKDNLEPDVNQPTNKSQKKMFHKKKTTRRVTKFRKKLPSTLLEKLLQNEIQHERNIILQCVRYVVGKNFFEE